MQSVTLPTQSDKNNSTMRRGSLVADARENLNQAFEAWTAAFNRYNADKSTFNLAALEAACFAHQQAEAQYQSARIPHKYNRGTVPGGYYA
jgi:hypothetical protein